MARTADRKITATKNYRLFGRSGENRPIDMRKHKRLLRSMKKYGFLASFPIVCCRDKEKHLIVKEGQHRLAIAEELGLVVYYVVEDVDFDVAEINSTPVVWKLSDYAEKHAANGIPSYSRGLDFAKSHKLPVGIAFALLGGTTTFSNVEQSFKDGTFTIKDSKWADAVAGLYCRLGELSSEVKSARLIEACMAVCRVDDFDSERLIRGASRCREKLVSYSTRDAYLDMMEEVYNYGRKQLVSLKLPAIEVMRKRSAVNGKAKTNGKVSK